MNTHTPVTAVSTFNSRDNSCYASDPSVATLHVVTNDERSYQLPYAQFLFAELAANPALPQDPDAPPERLLIRFAVADVTVLGSGLAAITRAMQAYELKFVKAIDARYATALKTHVASVTIQLNRDVP